MRVKSVDLYQAMPATAAAAHLLAELIGGATGSSRSATATVSARSSASLAGAARRSAASRQRSTRTACCS